jgi:hypothetical protein
MNFTDILKNEQPENIAEFLVQIMQVVQSQNAVNELTIKQLLQDRRDLHHRNLKLKEQIEKMQKQVEENPFLKAHIKAVDILNG